MKKDDIAIIQMVFVNAFLVKVEEGFVLIDTGLAMHWEKDATIIHIPGHTKGSIGIVTNDGELFAGDTFTNMRKPDIATYIENSGELKNSIARLKKLNIRTIYPGHGKPFEMESIARQL